MILIPKPPSNNISSIIFFPIYMSQPHFEGSVRSPLTLPKMGLGNPPGLPKTQNAIARAKTPCIKVYFIPLKRS
jgi:hypothetical protein